MSIYKNRAREYHDRIRKILINEWDPIGIKDILEAQDEYDSYVSDIYKMLISKKSLQEIKDYLWLLETEHMGLNGNHSHTDEIAVHLLELIVV